MAISNIFRSRETLEPTDFSCFLVDLSDKLDARTPGHVAIRAETEVAAAAADDKSVAGDKQANDLDRVDISWGKTELKYQKIDFFLKQKELFFYWKT